MKTPIVGGSAVSRSRQAAYNKLVNLFPCIVKHGGKEQAYLTRCPGLRKIATVGNGPIRGMIELNGVGYIASGSKLYSLTENLVVTELGTIVGGTGSVSMAYNGIQIFVSCNPSAYLYNVSTAAFSQITDADFAGSKHVRYIDGYFVFNQPNSRKFWKTALLDGAAIDGLDFASVEANPSNITALEVDHREVFLFSKTSCEVWGDAGTAGFPFERINGAIMDVGCIAPDSVARMDNSLFFLGADKNGYGMVYRIQGYNPVAISDDTIGYAIESYKRQGIQIEDAIAYCYQSEHHVFYVLTFPSANKTWCYDAATGLWHERAGFVSGDQLRHRSNCHMSFLGYPTVGDFENGNIYALDQNVYSDNGSIQKWERSWRAMHPGSNEGGRQIHRELQIDFETGVGLVSGQGSDPVVNLIWSDDGGNVWSNYHSKQLGKIGEYNVRVIWHRLGAVKNGRDRIYEVSGTDPVKIEITAAWLT